MSEHIKDFDSVEELISFIKNHPNIKDYKCKIKLIYDEDDDNISNMTLSTIVKDMINENLLAITKDMLMYDILIQLAPVSRIVDWLLSNYNKNTVMSILDYIDKIEKSVVDVSRIRSSYFDKYIIYELGKESEN